LIGHDKSFNGPTQEEAVHDYVWRVRMAIPQKGQISHYEDIIEVCVHDSVPEK
jgi:polyphosphate kinase 2 (PPK2 family)